MVVYLDVSKTDEVQPATFSNNTPTVEKPIQATLAYPEGQDVAVSLTVDPSLVATYNARYGSDWKMLDAKYYELSSDNVTIHAGKTASEVVTLRLKGLMGEGEQQTGALPIDETYLLPVRISHSSMSVLKGLRGRLLCCQTLFGHHRRGAAYGQLDRIPGRSTSTATTACRGINSGP